MPLLSAFSVVFLIITILLTIPFVQSQVAINVVGEVLDAVDNLAEGHTVMIYKQTMGKTDALTQVLGIENTYMINCRNLIDPCVSGDVIVAEVIDNGDHYIAGPVTTTINSQDVWYEMDDMTLYCSFDEYEVIVNTDHGFYSPGSAVTLSGKLVGPSCSPAEGKYIAILVKDPNGTPFFVAQLLTGAMGEFTTTFIIEEGSEQGEYEVSASYQSLTGETQFDVSDCEDNDQDGYCSDVDCNDADENVNPGVAEVCDNVDNDCDGTIDTIQRLCSLNYIGVCGTGTETCTSGAWAGCPQSAQETCNDLDDDCDGTSDEDGVCDQSNNPPSNPPTGGTTGGTTGPSGGAPAFAPPASNACEESWSCSEWSECINNERTRVCEEENGCGTEDNRPAESESCQATGGSSESAGCGDGICDTGTEGCELCPEDCGECEVTGEGGADITGQAVAGDNWFSEAFTGFMTSVTSEEASPIGIGVGIVVIIIIAVAALKTLGSTKAAKVKVNVQANNNKKHYSYSRGGFK